MNIGALTASLGIDAAGLNRAAAKMNEFQRTVDASAKKVNASLKSTGDAMKQMGATATRNLTVPIALAATAAVKLFSDYEASISKVVGLVGVASETTDKWAKDILKIAPEVAKAPAELADALFFVTSAGIRGAEAMDVLTISAKASAAGLGETKVVADLVTSAMNAYGKENLNAAMATDILVATVKEGKAEASELASSMGMVLPIASAMSVGFNEVGAAIAAMTRTGTNAATASTQLRQILNSIIKPSKQSEEAMRAMGTSAKQLRETIREDGLLKALLDIDKLTKKFGEDTVAKVFPNIRAMSGVLDLMGKNVEDNVKIFDSLNNSAGSLEGAMAAAADTFKFQFNQAVVSGKVALTVLGESIASALLPVLQKLTGWLTRLAEWFNTLTESQKKWVLGIGLAVAAIGPLLTVLGVIVGSIIPAAINGFLLLGKAIATLTKIMLRNPYIALGAALAFLVIKLINLKRGTIAAAEGQEKLNKAIQAGEDLIEGGQGLSDKANIAGTLNKRQLDSLKTNLTAQLSLEEDFTASLSTELAKRLSADEKLAALRTKTEKAITDKVSGIFIAGLQNQIQERKEAVAADLELENQAGKERVKILQESLNKVENAIQNAKEAIAGGGGIIPPAITEALAAFAMGSERIIKLQKAFGDSFDVVGAKIGLYEESIVALVDAGVDPLSDSIQILSGRLDSLDFQASAVPLIAMEANMKKVIGVANQMRNFSAAQDIGIIDSDKLFVAAKSLDLVTNKLDNMGHIAFAARDAMEELSAPAMFETLSNTVSSLGGLFQSLGNIMNDVFGENNPLTAFLDGIGKVLSVMDNIAQVMGFINVLSGVASSLKDKETVSELANAGAKAVNTATTAAGIPVVAAAVGAQNTLAAANTAVAITGAAASVSWIPIVGVGLAIAGVIALLSVLSRSKSKSTGMATGGIVPPGYPNDSFDAQLTSNEAVIPLDRLPQLMGMNKNGTGGEVRFIIEGDTLVGVLDNNRNISNAF